MRFFVDGCISILHAQTLRLYYESEGHEFCHLTEKFPADTPDPVWISALAQESDWVIVSGDSRIMTNPANKQAWHESGLTAFFFGAPWPETKLLKQAEAVLHWAPRLVAVAKKHPTGHGFIMNKSSPEPRQIFPEVKKK